MAKNALGVQIVHINTASDIFHIYFSLPRSFRLNILLNVENIAKTILVALEISISIFRKDHSVL